MHEILLIEDDKDYRESLKDILEDMDCTVSEAVDGEEGLALLKKNPVEMVVSDIVMPNKEKVILMTGVGSIGGQPFVKYAKTSWS